MKTNTTILALVAISLVGCAHAHSGDEQPVADLGGFIDPTVPVSPGPVCIDDPCIPVDSADTTQLVVDMAQLTVVDMAMVAVDMSQVVDMAQSVDMAQVQDLASPVDMAETPDMADDCESNNGHGHGWGNIKHNHCVPEKGKHAD